MPARRTGLASGLIGFIDRVNRGDPEGLVAMMTDDHELRILDEPPVVGREANRKAWRAYMTSFPRYAILPHRIAPSARIGLLPRHGPSSLALSHEP